MGLPRRPTDVVVANGWYLEIPFPGIGENGLFETLEGIKIEAGVVERVDAGTNRKLKFSTQLIDYGEMTLTRPYDNTETDRAIELMANQMIQHGLRLPVVATKLHHGKPIFQVLFEGFFVSAADYPTWDVASEEKFTVTYKAHCETWTPIPIGK